MLPIGKENPCRSQLLSTFSKAIRTNDLSVQKIMAPHFKNAASYFSLVFLALPYSKISTALYKQKSIPVARLGITIGVCVCVHGWGAHLISPLHLSERYNTYLIKISHSLASHNNSYSCLQTCIATLLWSSFFFLFIFCPPFLCDCQNRLELYV